MLGTVIGGGETVGSLEPPPLAMLAGRADASADGESRSADLLASRPGIALKFTGQVAAADVRWLHEQKLRAEL
jgi:hypothetical protein